jgi:hypothetical protein
MRRFITIAFALSLALSVAACGQPDRKTADQKFLRACEAIVKHMHPPEDMIEIVESAFSDDRDADGTELRRVHIEARYTQNRGLVDNKSYDCWFAESRGLGGYNPSFYRAEIDGQRFGKYGMGVEGEPTAIIEMQAVAEKELFR